MNNSYLTKKANLNQLIEPNLCHGLNISDISIWTEQNMFQLCFLLINPFHGHSLVAAAIFFRVWRLYHRLRTREKFVKAAYFSKNRSHLPRRSASVSCLPSPCRLCRDCGPKILDSTQARQRILGNHEERLRALTDSGRERFSAKFL